MDSKDDQDDDPHDGVAVVNGDYRIEHTAVIYKEVLVGRYVGERGWVCKLIVTVGL